METSRKSLRKRTDLAKWVRLDLLALEDRVVPAITINPPPELLESGQVGDHYYQSFLAQGGSGAYQYSLTGQLPVGLSLGSNGILTGSPQIAGSYSFTISARDTLTGLTGSQNYTVSTQLGLGLPQILNATVGVAFTHGIYLSPTGGSGNYSVQVTGELPPGMQFANTTGPLFTSNARTPQQAGQYPFTVVATDLSTNLVSTQQVTLNVGLGINPSQPLSPIPLGQSYTNQFLAMGGPTNSLYQYTATTSLPPGLTLSSDGVLSGVPTVAGEYTFTVLTTDQNNPTLTGTSSFQLDVGLQLTPLRTGPGPVALSPATKDVAFLQPFFATGGSSTFRYSIPSWSSSHGESGSGDFNGLTLHPNTGNLKGTPQKSGTYTFTIRAEDVNLPGLHVETSYQLEVGSLTLSPAVLPPANTGVPYKAKFSASGSQGTLSFSIAQWTNQNGQSGFGSFNGLTLDEASGELRGTPLSAGQYQLLVSARDSQGKTGLVSVPLVFFSAPKDQPISKGPLVFSLQNLPEGKIGQAYSQKIQAFNPGPSSKLVYSVSGSLPPGFDFSPNGLLSGVPTLPGQFSFTVTGVDLNTPGLTGQHEYTLTIPNPVLASTGAVKFKTRLALPPTTTANTSNLTLPQEKIPVNSLLGFSSKGGSVEIDVLDSEGKSKKITLTYTSIDVAKGELTGCSGGKPGDILLPQRIVNPLTAKTKGLDTLPVSDITGFSTKGGSIKHAAGTIFYSGVDSVQSELTGISVKDEGEFKQNEELISTGEWNLEGVESLNVWSTVGFPTSGGTIRIQTTDGSVVATYDLCDDQGFKRLKFSQSKPGTTRGNYQISLLDSSEAPFLTPQILAPATVNQPYTGLDSSIPYSVSGAGGSGNLTYEVTQGILPPGLALSPTTGEFLSSLPGVKGAGKPTAMGTYSFTVTVTDALGKKGSRQYSITVQPEKPSYTTPQQIQKAYGIDQIILSGGIKGDGTGQTIGIIAYGDYPFYQSSSSPSTTIGAGSNNVRVETATTIAVESTAGFPETGTFPVVTDNGTVIVAYTGKTATSFTGCKVKEYDGCPKGGRLFTGNSVGYTATDLYLFSDYFGIKQPPSFLKIDQFGGTNYPPAEPDNFGEIAQDVQWAHAIAPGANIVLIVCDPTSSNFDTALSYPGITVISSSYTGGFANANVVLNSLGQPRTFVNAAGDNNSQDPPPQPPQQPGEFPYTLAAGMTGLSTDIQGNRIGEVGNVFANRGPSKDVEQPAYQNGIVDAVSTTRRTNPDVSFVGEATSTLSTDTAMLQAGLWQNANGTSLAAPSWAGLIAIANQARQLSGQTPLNGPIDTLQTLYILPDSDFNKMVYVDNGGLSIGSATYNQSGLGTPVANRLIPGLAGGHNTITGQVKAGAGQKGWQVYLSPTPDTPYHAGLASTITGEDGSFSFLVAPGTYYVNSVPPAQWKLPVLTSQQIQFPAGQDYVHGLTMEFTAQANRVYVNNLYQLLLQREPGAQSDFWVNLLDSGVSPKTVVAMIQKSPEYLANQVKEQFEFYLGRTPGSGLGSFVSAMQLGMTIEQLTNLLVGSDEFFDKAGGTNLAYVTTLYQMVLGREGDNTGIDSWTNWLNRGNSRMIAAAGFTGSLEYCNLVVNGQNALPDDGQQQQIDSLFQGYFQNYLQRKGTVGGAYTWAQALFLGETTQDLVLAGILGSEEGFQLWS